MRHLRRIGRFPVQLSGASNPWRGAKEVSGVALVVAQEVPASSSMAVPHGPAGVGQARHRMREQLRGNGVSDAVVDDAVLILSELLSNACRHGRPLGQHTDVGDGDVRAAWRVDTGGGLTVEVTDGGGPTRPVPATPSVTARGGRGLNIISALAQEWGVRDDAPGEVTVWALVSSEKPPGVADGFGPDGSAAHGPGRNGSGRNNSDRNGRGTSAVAANGIGGLPGFEGLDFSDVLDDVG
ncbi:ATP-binding protein [Streptomyces sp. NPDC059164]|uniref:ATP-binding protein n=1 Tax=unclassified Streptomyces TaxID=2593676 RepID=UPI0009333EAB|nr:ATP-binding protein [Streptomyces sp. NBRC 110465]